MNITDNKLKSGLKRFIEFNLKAYKYTYALLKDIYDSLTGIKEKDIELIVLMKFLTNLQKECISFKRQYLSLKEEMEWKLFSTVPRDGTWVELTTTKYQPDFSCAPIFVTRWEERTDGHGMETGEYYWSNDADHIDDEKYFTHWRLYKPPVKQ